MLKRIIVLLMIFILAVAIVSELLLPQIVAKGLETGLENLLGRGQTIDTTIKAYPALKMFVGRFDEITVRSKNINAAGLLIDSVSATIKNVAINLRDLLAQREIAFEELSDEMTVEIQISEANLRQYVLATIPEISDPRVDIDGGMVQFAGNLSFSGSDFFVSLVGRFEATDETTVSYIIEGIAVDGVELSPAFVEKVMQMLGGPDIFIDMAKFPLPLTVEGVQMEDGFLTITGLGTH